MQSWPSDPQSPFGPDPAAQWQSSEHRSSKSRILVLFAVLGLLFILAVGLGIFWLLRQAVATTPSAPRETIDERIAASTAAYASDAVGVTGPIRQRVEAMLEEVEKAAVAESDSAFRRLIDFKRMVAYVSQNPEVADTNRLILLGFRLQISNNVTVDPAWQTIMLRHVDPIPGTDQLVVYTHCYDSNGFETDIRFWVTDTAERLKIGDWQRLDLGMRHSREWAMALAYSEDSRWDDYLNALDDLNRSAELASAGEASAENLLRQVENRQYLPELRDMMLVLLGYHWNDLGEPSNSLRCLERVSQPAATPGVYVARAIAHSQLAEYDQAIESMTRYEATVGFTPGTSRMKADWFERLGRRAEEAEEWKKVLRIEPADVGALLSLARLLEDSQLDVLFEYLQRADDPLARVESLAMTLSGRDSQKGSEMLEDYVTETWPESATAAYLAGIRLRDQDRLEEAADRFREALKATLDDDRRYTYLSEYVAAIVESHRVLQGYEAVERQEELFSFLLDGHDEGDRLLTDQELDSLIDIHRRLHPDDAVGAYYQGCRLDEQGDLEAAAAALREAVRQSEPDDWRHEAARARLRGVLVSAGKPLEAWRLDDGDAEVAGSSAYDVASICLAQSRWNELRQLLVTYREEHPDDESLVAFETAVLIREGKLEEAKASIRQMATQNADFTAHYGLNHYWAHPQIWEFAYRQVAGAGDASEFVQNVARQFESEGRWNDLRRLIDMYLEHSPQDLSVASLEESLLVTQRDWARFANRWLPLRDRFFEEEDVTWRYRMFGETLVRALLRCNRSQDAMQLATRIREEKQDLLPSILCHAVAGRVQETCELIEKYLADYGSMFLLYDDDLIGSRLRSPEFAELQERHPIEIPYGVGEYEVVMLLKQLPDWDAALVQAALQNVGDAVNVTLLPEDGTSPRFVAACDDVRILISLHAGRYFEDRAGIGAGTDSSYRQALTEHQAWISVAVVDWAEAASRLDKATLVRDVVLRLPDEDCLAFWRVETSRLLGNNPQDRERWAAVDTLADWSEVGVYVDLEREYPEPDIIGQRNLSRALRRLRRAFLQRQEADQFLLAADLNVASSAERLWITLEEITDQSDYIGRLRQDSLVVPELVAGTRLLFSSYEISACRLEHAGETIVAEPVLGR